jgi:ureidoglycolate hydrolase
MKQRNEDAFMKKDYIDISSYTGEGYLPMIDFKSWRVAVLRYCEELEVQNLKTMQKHNETDEVFILLAGKCTLFVGGKGDEVKQVDGVAMKPLQLYNVKQGVWHTHTLDQEATVLIVENQDTSDSNSPKVDLTEEQIEELRYLFDTQIGF